MFKSTLVFFFQSPLLIVTQFYPGTQPDRGGYASGRVEFSDTKRVSKSIDKRFAGRA